MDFLQWLSSNEELGVVMILSSLGALISVLCIVSSTIRAIRRDEKQAELKQSMVEQGMSAQDIERVLKM